MKKYYRFLVVYLFLGLAILFVNLHEDISVPANRPLNEIPMTIGDWRMVSQSVMDEQELSVLKPTDTLSRVYVNGAGNRVVFYLGYHGGGPDSGPIHSPKHCLPGGGWQILQQEKKAVAVVGGVVSCVQAVYQQGEGKVLFLYWFQVKGAVLTNEYALKLAEIKNSILYNRRDSAFIRISVTAGDDVERAVAVAERFVRDFYPSIVRVLPE